MSISDPLAGQLDQIIASVLLPLERNGVDIIDPAFVAAEVVRKIDPAGASPPLLAYASNLQIRDRARHAIAARHDPVKRAEQYAQGETDDLFGDVLQPFYPVRREVGGVHPGRLRPR